MFNQNDKLLSETGFNQKNFSEVIMLQDKLNSKIHPEWMKQDFNFKLANILESAELLDSFDWKWWKKGETDWLNIEVEMIDIFLFSLSQSIIDNTTESIGSILLTKDLVLKSNKKEIIFNDELVEKIQDIMQKKLIPAINVSTIHIIVAWTEIWYLMGFDSDYLFKQFKMKYALNQFRQSNGYKDGTYNKIWNGKEDNLHALQFATTIPNDENFIDALIIMFNTEYATVTDLVARDIKSFITDTPKYKLLFPQMKEADRNVMVELALDYHNYMIYDKVK